MGLVAPLHPLYPRLGTSTMPVNRLKVKRLLARNKYLIPNMPKNRDTDNTIHNSITSLSSLIENKTPKKIYIK